MAKRTKTGGRTRGTTNKSTREVKAFAESLISRPLYVKRLRSEFDNGTVDVKLQILMWHYAKGQPTKHVEHSGTLTLEEIVSGKRREAK